MEVRVTNFDVNQVVTQKLLQTQSSLAEKQLEISSGKAFQKTSDDPIRANKSMLLKASENRIDQYLNNIDDAESFLKKVEGVLGNTIDVLQLTREAALQAKNDTTNKLDRNTLADTVEQQIKQVVALANTKHLDKYIFSGEKTKTESFTYNGTSATYNGDSGQLKIEVSNRLDMDITKPGDAIFTNLINNMINLRDQIRTGTNTDIETALQNFDGTMNQVVEQRADFGIKVDSLENLKNSYEQTKLNVGIQKSDNEDIDLTKVITEYTRIQQIYQATIQSTVKMKDLSLVNYL